MNRYDGVAIGLIIGFLVGSIGVVVYVATYAT